MYEIIRIFLILFFFEYGWKFYEIFSQFNDFSKTFVELQTVKDKARVRARNIIRKLITLQKMVDKEKIQEKQSEFDCIALKFQNFYIMDFKYKVLDFKDKNVILLETLNEGDIIVIQFWKWLSNYHKKKYEISEKLIEDCELDIKKFRKEYDDLYNAVFF